MSGLFPYLTRNHGLLLDGLNDDDALGSFCINGLQLGGALVLTLTGSSQRLPLVLLWLLRAVPLWCLRSVARFAPLVGYLQVPTFASASHWADAFPVVQMACSQSINQSIVDALVGEIDALGSDLSGRASTS